MNSNIATKSWEDIKAEFDDVPFIRRAALAAIDRVAHTSTYGEDAILDCIAASLQTNKQIQEHGLTVYRGGRHIAIVANGKSHRFAFFTVAA